MQRSMISSSVICAARDAGFLRGLLDQRVHFRIGRRLAILIVAIPARAGLLPVAAHLKELFEHQRRAQPGFSRCLRSWRTRHCDIDAAHVVHGENPHRHAEIGERAVHLLGRGAFFHQELRLAHVGEHHAIADEAPAVAHHHAHLAQLLRERQRRGDNFLAGGLAAHDFHQPHHVARG